MKTGCPSGHTLIEVLLASLLIGLIFLILTTLYVSGLKLFRGQLASPDNDFLVAFETIARKASLANEAIVDMNGYQVRLRIDSNDPATATANDDQWIGYRYFDIQTLQPTNGAEGAQIRSTPPKATSAEANVTSADAEVVPNLQFLGRPTQAPFSLVNPTSQGDPTVLKVLLVALEGANSPPRTLSTNVALKRAK